MKQAKLYRTLNHLQGLYTLRGANRVEASDISECIKFIESLIREDDATETIVATVTPDVVNEYVIVPDHELWYICKKAADIAAEQIDWKVIVETAALYLEGRVYSDEELESLWDLLGQAGIDDDGITYIGFLHFPARINREEIWRWFDQNYSGGVAALQKGE